MALENMDKEVYDLLQSEKNRQICGLELIASENFTSQQVLECLGSEFTNKYSEGLPNKRYYGGNEFIDTLELLCQERCLKAFDLNPEAWGVNVQSYSGSIANLSAMNAVLNIGDKIMGLSLTSGGHLSHGFKVNISSKIFNSQSYTTNDDGFVDYDLLHSQALEFKPNLIIGGASAYSRDWNYKKMSETCKEINALFMVDISHTAGMIASKLLNNPFEYADIVTTTTHKTLRGPRAGLIFFRKELSTKINNSVFPCIQGGPHNNQIAGIATQMKEVNTEKFKEYSKQVIKNAKVLSKTLIDLDFNILTDGTDNHLILVDLTNKKINGSRMEYLCDLVNITLNKNTVPRDKSALNPSGIRIGTPALTTRRFNGEDFKQIGFLLNETVNLAIKINTIPKLTKNLNEFKNRCDLFKDEILLLKEKIIKFSLLNRI